jgi:hypothetical protein
MMNVVAASRIIGSFLGYAPGVVHRLDDASEWEQVSDVKEYVYKERPSCRITFDRDRIWLAVEGMNRAVEVRRYEGRRLARTGAY